MKLSKLRNIIREEIKSLKESRLDKKTRDKFDNLKYSRKPTDWNRVEALRPEHVDDDVQYAIMHELPIVKANDNDGRIEHTDSPVQTEINDEQLRHIPFIYIVRGGLGGNEAYLVEANGYEYIRYALRLEGFRI